MKPKVSVIIPCYNYSNYIEQCLLSVVSQNINFNIEVLIGDDKSTDNSFEIAKRFARYYESEKLVFKVYSNDVNLGEILNTKFLLEKCEGEYIAYLDADDYWTEPNKLIKQVEFMDNNLDCSMCFTGYIILKNGVNYVPTTDFSYWLCPSDINSLNSELLSIGNPVGSSSSRLFRNYGLDLFKDYFHEFPYSDWVINFELSLKGKIEYLDFPSYVYRTHIDSLSTKDLEYDLEYRTNLYNKRTSILKNRLDNLKK